MAKTRNHSIRFEQSDFDFICKREKLTTAQSIVSFLMDNYIKIYKVEKRSVFLVEDNQDYDAPKKMESIIKPKLAINRTPALWLELRRDCQTADDFSSWLEDLENDTFLTSAEKKQVKITV